MTKTLKISVIGAGLAGCECAWRLAELGLEVELYEMKPEKMSPAHSRKEGLAELVCSNSLRSDDSQNNAVGLLHEEMRMLGSLVMEAAEATKVPAGGALAVNRDLFSDYVTAKIKSHSKITFISREISKMPDGIVVVATGPLTSDVLTEEIMRITGEKSLHFFDAIAPIIYTDSVDMAKAWYQSRYDKGDGNDYLNCAMDKQQYIDFVEALKAAQVKEFKEFELQEKERYFEGCLPIEEMAKRGVDTLAYGPMKPVGLRRPGYGARHHAVVQLRKENREGTLMNMVGFQTKMTYPEQQRVLRMIPGLENAEFARMGGVHRNTFIKSPLLLDAFLRLKSNPAVRFAGQISGCEGYVESAAMGLLAGIFTGYEVSGKSVAPPDNTTAIGAVLEHVTNHLGTHADASDFQPMNVNFGLFAPMPDNGDKKKKKGKEGRIEITGRAKENLKKWKTLHEI